MTTTHSPRRRYALALVPLLALALLASACTGLASPRGWASPVLLVPDGPDQEGLLLVSQRDELFALDPADYSPLWAFPQPSSDNGIDVDALYGTPAVLGETAFVPGYDGGLYAVDIGEEGGIALPGWPFVTEDSLVGGVAVSEDTVYFGSSDGNIYALNAESGLQSWPLPFQTGEAVWATPTLVGDTLYATSLDGNLYALDAATGAERWRFKTSAGIASPPIVDAEAGLVYIAGYDTRLRAIDLETHDEVWQTSADNWFWTRPLLADGVIYAGSLDGKVYAADAATGDLVWPPFDVGDPIRSAPIISDGQLVIISRDGNVHGIDLQTGTPTLGTPVVLDSDVLVDPIVRLQAEGSEDAGEEILLTTTDGDLLTLDGTTLQITGSRRLGS